MTMLRRGIAFFAADATARAIAFVVLVAAARVLGPAEFGRFAFVYAVVAIGLLLADFGLTPLVLRQLSRSDRFDARLFWSAAGVNVVIGASLYLTLVLVLSASSRADVGVASVYGLVLVVQAVATSIDAALLASGKAPLLGTLRVAGNVVLALTATLALLISPSAVSVGAAFTAGAIAKLLLTALASRNIVTWARPSAKVAVVLLRRSAPFALAALVSFLYFRIDIIFLRILADARTVGEYAAAYRVLDALILAPAAIAYTFFPRWSRDRRVGHDFAYVAVTLITLGVVAAVGLAIFGPRLSDLVFGTSFGTTGDVIRILALGVPVLFFDVVAVWIAYSRGRERGVVIVSAVALVTNVALNLLLIPSHGAAGAAIATVVSECVNGLGYVVLLGGLSSLSRIKLVPVARVALPPVDDR